MTFLQSDLLDRLEAADWAELDATPFGVIGMSSDGVVVRYNAFESERADLEPATVMGQHFFSQADVGQIPGGRTVGQPFALLMLDIDWFKWINDGSTTSRR